MKRFAQIVSFLVFTFSSTISSQALDWIDIAQAISDNESIELEAGATYTAGTPTFTTTAGNLVYFEFYTGELNGNGASIIGLTAPLFEQLGFISDGATVSNLNLVTQETSGVSGKGVLADQSINAVISQVNVSGQLDSVGSDFAGGIVGNAFDTSIIDSSSNIEIVGDDNVGGLVGEATGLTSITNSTASGLVHGQNYVGGLVGSASAGTEIVDSQSLSDVVGNQYVGGIVGYQNGGLISNSSSNGNISGIESVGGVAGYSEGLIEDTEARGIVSGSVSGQAVGGIVGEAYGEIRNSNFDGDVEGNNYFGGIAGVSYGDIRYSFSSGNVTGSAYVGGIVGYAEAVAISDSYSRSDIYGEDYVGGIAGTLLTTVSGGDSISSTVSNSFFIGNVIGTGSTIGGIAGLASGGVIENVYSSGTASGIEAVGGILGQAESDVLIQNVFSLTDLSVSGGTAGGLIGASYNSTISNAISKMTLTSNSLSQQLGGMIGYALDTEITNVEFEGEISGGNYLGGLIGLSDNSTIQNSQSKGSIEGFEYLGGLIGFADNLLTLEGSFSQMNLSGESKIGGLIGYVQGVNNVNGVIVNDSKWNGSILSLDDLYDDALIGYAVRLDDVNSFPYYLTNPRSDSSYQYNALIFDSIPVVGQLLGRNLDLDLEISQPSSVLNDFDTNFTLGNTWASCSTLNDSLPYLISLYQNNPCEVPREALINLTSKLALENSSRYELSYGFKSLVAANLNPIIKFQESVMLNSLSDKKLSSNFVLRSIQSLELAKESTLQLKLFFEPNKSVELWLMDADGKILKIGEIQFDSFGRAVLPPLEFLNIGNFNLLFVEKDVEIGKIEVSISD